MLFRSDAAQKRRRLLRQLELPENMTANALLEAVNLLGGKALLERLVRQEENE